MIGKTTGMEKSAKCAAAITAPNTIATFGVDDDTLALATSAIDAMLGIFQHTTTAAGETARIMMTGISDCKLGGTVARGKPVTADASGKGVQAAANQSSVGTAMASGVAGDIIPVFLMPFSVV